MPRDMISFSGMLSGKFADLVYFPTTARETRLEALTMIRSMTYAI